MDEIDCKAELSREDKHHQRCEVAAQALAELEASKTLMRAREAVRHGASPGMLKALEQAEAGWKRAMDKIAERAGRTTGQESNAKCFSTRQKVPRLWRKGEGCGLAPSISRRRAGFLAPGIRIVRVPKASA
jgi:hypothetical protein